MKFSGYLADFYKMQFPLKSLDPHLGSWQSFYFYMLTEEISPFSKLISCRWTANYLSKSIVKKYLIFLPTQLYLSPMKPSNGFLLLLEGLRLPSNSEVSLLAVVECVALNYLKVLFVRNWAILVTSLSSSKVSIYLVEKWMNAFVCETVTAIKTQIPCSQKTTGSLGVSFLDHCHLQRALGVVLFGRSCRCAVLAQNIYILSFWNS